MKPTNAQLKAEGRKHCSGCGEIKSRTEFSPNGVSPNGVVYVAKLCKPCNAANERSKRIANPKPSKLRIDISPEKMTKHELRNVGLKRCTVCKEIKPRSGFHSNSNSDGSLRGECIPCHKEKQRGRRAENPDRYRENERTRLERPGVRERKREQRRAWREANLEKAKADATRRDLFAKFNITVEQYEEILKAQGGACAICREQCKTGRRLSVDHDHGCCPGKGSCGRCIRGLLCAGCNTGLGHLGDDYDRLIAAAEYLKNYNPS